MILCGEKKRIEKHRNTLSSTQINSHFNLYALSFFMVKNVFTTKGIKKTKEMTFLLKRHLTISML